MAAPLTLEEVRVQLALSERLDDPFSVLRTLAQRAATADAVEQGRVRDLVIRALERRVELNGYSQLLDSLAVSVGLYPYAIASNLSVRDALEYEAHRPDGLDDLDIVFHRTQALIYQYLLDGESVILSAPTSFGKSLIVDGLLASGRYENVAIIVPTIALIDETRRRISERFGERFKVITHPSQALSDRNAFVMTQERILDVSELPELDIFVLDEFYKLDPRGDRERATLLNQAFYRLRKHSRQFYMLGPNIQQLPTEMNEIARVVVTDFMTVALDTIVVKRTGDDVATLVELCSSIEGPTLIFCKSPAQAKSVAMALVDARVTDISPGMTAASDWVSEEFHADWSFNLAIQRGIGLHHGRIPRSLGQLVVRKFNSGDIRILVCTSTLIEGVNTAAKNVIVFDNKIAQRKYDFFTFNNIRGRSGRMFQHFIGHVYLFHSQPEEELPFVDVPVLTQPEGTDPSLLVQLDDEDLSETGRDALETVLDDDVLPREDIRQSSGVDPERQVQLAAKLRAQRPSDLRVLGWSGYPNTAELRHACDLIWNDLDGKRYSSSYVRSANQLAYRLSRLSRVGQSGLIKQALGEMESPDDAVEGVLEFTRNWAGFHFPRLLMAVDRIQRRVMSDRGMRPGSYVFYATSVESLFLPSTVAALEEYGIPLQVALQLTDVIQLTQPLDAVLDALRQIDLSELHVDGFALELISETLATL